MKEFTLSNPIPKNYRQIDYEKELNAEQLEVVQNAQGPCLVLAGAGSGKTRVITYRVAWLLQQGIAPANILLLTFTNKAAKEMIGRVEFLLGAYPQGLWAGTFHSIANRILRQYATCIGHDPNFTILDQEDARDMVGLCVKELKIDTKGKRFPNSAVLQELLSFRANKGCTLEQAVELKHPKFLHLLYEIEKVAELYPQRKLQQNAMDFDDLLNKLLSLLQSRPDILANLSNQFQYVLVDEFQDTNVVQAKIVHLLASVHKNLLVVGDDAQSIYSFRAAEIKNILSFPELYASVKTFKLTTNYRSTPQILSIANAVINQNKNQFTKELQAVCPAGEKPCVVPAANAAQEAHFVVDRLLDLHNDGLPLHNIAVLFRAAFHSQAVEFELMKRDVPYEYRGGMKFFERAHIKDAVAHLRIMHNIRDGVAWIRALKIHPGIGMVTADNIARQAAAASSIDEVLKKEFSGKRIEAGWQGFLRVLRDLKVARQIPADLIRSFAASDDYQIYLEHEYPNFGERLDDLEQFAIFAEQFADMGDFLEAVSLTDEYGAVRERGANDETDKLILSTVHQAKGLEWENVFVINLTDNGFPNPRALVEEGGLEEERRLFYVAVTRAKQNLFLTYPITSGYETLEFHQPSSFLSEIPASEVDVVKLRQGLSQVMPFEQSAEKGNQTDEFGEPTIVLDELGEKVKKKAPTSFLRNIDELY